MATATEPQVGDKVWYLLQSMEVPEWVEAEIIDHIKVAGDVEPPLDDGGYRHLRISLDRRRHNSASAAGYRLNVPRGAAEVSAGVDPSYWLPAKPKDADAVRAEALAELEMRNKIGREQAAVPTRPTRVELPARTV